MTDYLSQARSHANREVAGRSCVYPPLTPAQEEMRAAFAAQKEICRGAKPIPGEGRGIVTLAGGATYFAAGYVLVRRLRDMGCLLPIEWWVIGGCEIDLRMRKIAESLPGVEVVLLNDRVRECGEDIPTPSGWQAKCRAISYSRFREVLFLDADQVPARDPSYLFDSSEYQESGAVFWPDFLPYGWDITAAAFRVAGLPIPGNTRNQGWHKPTDYRPFESGQILLDKPRNAGPLALCRWINDRADFWYPEPAGKLPWLIYGDKSTFYLAWESLKHPYAMPPDCTRTGGNQQDFLRGGAFLQQDFSGDIVFQHRVQPPAKWNLAGDNTEPPGFVGHKECESHLSDLRTQWNGQPFAWGDMGPQDYAVANTLMGTYTRFHKGTARNIVLAKDGQTDTSGIGWTVRHNGNRPVLLLVNTQRSIAIWGQAENGWCNHRDDDFLLPRPFLECPPEKEAYAMIADVIEKNEYRLPDSFAASDVVLDIGGHVGAFAVACLSRGAGKVVSVEPIPDYCEMYSRNLAAWGGKSELIEAACDYREMAVMARGNHSGEWHSAESGELRAKGVSLKELLASLGKVRLLKFDCEGAEWPSLVGGLELSKTLAGVLEICGEYHLAQAGGYTIGDLRRVLEVAGFSVETVPTNPHLGHFFARRVSA